MSNIPKTKRGGGPQTKEGKLSASMNSLKTDVYASNLVLEGESESEFQGLEEQLLIDFAPKDVVEGLLIHDLAVLALKKLRLDRVEHKVMMAVINKPITSAELSQEGVSINWNDLSLIQDLTVYTEEFIEELKSNLEFLSRCLEYPIGKEDFYGLPKTHPGLYQRIVTLLGTNLSLPRRTSYPSSLRSSSLKTMPIGITVSSPISSPRSMHTLNGSMAS